MNTYAFPRFCNDKHYFATDISTFSCLRSSTTENAIEVALDMFTMFIIGDHLSPIATNAQKRVNTFLNIV